MADRRGLINQPYSYELPTKAEYERVLQGGGGWQYRHHNNAGISPFGLEEGWHDVRRDLTYDALVAMGTRPDEEWRSQP